ncbi:MAG: hypothetical protein RI983_129, partial [Bacteroidota bacterium]
YDQYYTAKIHQLYLAEPNSLYFKPQILSNEEIFIPDLLSAIANHSTASC